MSKYKGKRKFVDVVHEEQCVTAMFAHKLEALFNASAHNTKNNGNKCKDRCGDKKNTQTKHKRTSKHSSSALKEELRLMIAFYGIGTPHITPAEQPKLSRECASMVDIDFEGFYFTPSVDDLSQEYAAYKTNALQYDIISPFSPHDYDLNQIPVWEDMKKFQSFRSMHRTITVALSKIAYNPGQLNKLQYADMLDIIAQHNKQNPQNRMPCQRTRFLKMFAAVYGEEFVTKMSILGKGKDATDFLSYIHYMDKPSKKMPIDARTAANKFNVHHGKNRKHANELPDYSQVNDFSNECLCWVFPHHKLLHYPCEIDINPNIVFLGGFLPDFQIIRNPAKERLYQQGLLRITHKNQQKSER
jgi:hypothetical protein